MDFFVNTMLYLQSFMGPICGLQVIKDTYHWDELGGCYNHNAIQLHQPLMSKLMATTGNRPDDYPEELYKTMIDLRDRGHFDPKYCPRQSTNDPTLAPLVDETTTECLFINETESGLLSGLEVNLVKHVNVLNTFHVLAEESIRDDLVLYVASIVATAIDANEDGEVDDAQLKEILANNKAHIVICADTESAAAGACGYYMDEYYAHGVGGKTPAFLLQTEINPQYRGYWGKDNTVIAVIRNILRFGLSELHPEVLGLPMNSDTSTLQHSMGYSISYGIMKLEGIPEHVWTCDLDCQMETYFAYGALSFKKILTEQMCQDTTIMEAWGLCHPHLPWTDEPLLKNGGEFWRNPEFRAWAQGIFGPNGPHPLAPHGKYNACEQDSEASDLMMSMMCNDGLSIEPTDQSEGDDFFTVGVYEKINVLNSITVYAPIGLTGPSQNPSPLQFAADVAAQLLDANNDGIVDSYKLQKQLQESNAQVFILAGMADFDMY